MDVHAAQQRISDVENSSGRAKEKRAQCTGWPTAPGVTRYRCFLPDLAGLAGFRRVGPGTRKEYHSKSWPWLSVVDVTGRTSLLTKGAHCHRNVRTWRAGSDTVLQHLWLLKGSSGHLMASNRIFTVFGAYGHTGRFVVSELSRRGLTPILAGRDAAKLHALRNSYPGIEMRVAAVDDPASIDRALSGVAAVINCAGPFIDTAAPLVEAALRARIPYLDVAAEQAAVLTVFERFAGAAKGAGVTILPAAAFYGGLGDLLATAAMGDWTSVDEILIAVALNSWKPTQGTRLTGERNHGRRLVFSNNRLEPADPEPARMWKFPPPFGSQEVVGLPLTEAITVSRHIQTREIHAYINLAPLTDLRNPDTSATYSQRMRPGARRRFS